MTCNERILISGGGEISWNLFKQLSNSLSPNSSVFSRAKCRYRRMAVIHKECWVIVIYGSNLSSTIWRQCSDVKPCSIAPPPKLNDIISPHILRNAAFLSQPVVFKDNNFTPFVTVRNSNSYSFQIPTAAQFCSLLRLDVKQGVSIVFCHVIRLTFGSRVSAWLSVSASEEPRGCSELILVNKPTKLRNKVHKASRHVFITGISTKQSRQKTETKNSPIVWFNRLLADEIGCHDVKIWFHPFQLQSVRTGKRRFHATQWLPAVYFHSNKISCASFAWKTFAFPPQTSSIC